jgi:hypothetical protein
LGKRDSSEHADNNPLKSRGQLEDAFYKQRGKTSLLLGPYPSLEGEGWNRFFPLSKKTSLLYDARQINSLQIQKNSTPHQRTHILQT